MIIMLVACFSLLISFAWYSDTKSADMNITVASGEGTANITASLLPQDLIAGNYFEKEISVNFKTTKNINFRTAASVITQATNSKGEQISRNDVVTLVGVNSTIKGADNMFYYSTTNSTTLTNVASGTVKLKFGFVVTDKIGDEQLRNSDGTLLTTLKTIITYVVDYAETDALSTWGSSLSGKTSYLAEFKSGDDILKIEYVEAGKTPTAPTNVTKPATSTVEYTFSGWSPALSAISANTTFTASFTEASTVAEFKTTWRGEINSALGLTEITTASDITGIRFDYPNTVPSEYQYNGKKLASGIKIYQSASKPTDIAFVLGKIKAPASCSQMFRLTTDGTNAVALTNLTTLIFKNFDTSNTNGFYMFLYSYGSGVTSALTKLDMSCFNTSKVTSMAYMFTYCTKLTELDVSNFDTLNVTSFTSMFHALKSLTKLNVSNFNTEKATSFNGMFRESTNLKSLDLSNFKSSLGVDMTNMFYNCTNLESVKFRNAISAKNMASMFKSCKNLKSVDFTGINTSSCTDMSSMFLDCEKLTSLDLSNFNTSNVTTMSNMFGGCKELTSIKITPSTFLVSKVTSFNHMFFNCYKLQSLDLSGFVTTAATDMGGMFQNCYELSNVNLSGFNTSKVTGMQYMFWNNNKNLTKLDLSTFNLGAITSDIDNMIGLCTSLVEIKLPATMNDTYKITLPTPGASRKWYDNGAEQINSGIALGTDFNGHTLKTSQDALTFSVNWRDEFAGLAISECATPSVITSIRFDSPSTLDTNSYTDTTKSFASGIRVWQGKTTKTDLAFVAEKIMAPEDCYRMFRSNLTHDGTSETSLGLGKLKTIIFNNFDTTNTINMGDMFMLCSAIENLDISSFNTSKVENIAYLFYGCSTIKYPNMTGLDLSKVKEAQNAFIYCPSLRSVDITTLTSSTLSNVKGMFMNCGNLTSLDLSNLNLTSVTAQANVAHMLTSCTSLLELKAPKNIQSGISIALPTKTGYSWYEKGTTTALTELKTAQSGKTLEFCVTKQNTSEPTVQNLTFEKDWKTQIVEKGLGFTDISAIKSIRFDTLKTIPTGYTQKATLTSGIKIYGNGTAGYISFVADKISAPQSSQELFKNCTAMTEIIFNNFDTSTTTDISGMFHTCSALVSVDLSSFDVSHINGGGLMGSLFANCGNLESVNITGWNVSNTKWFPSMFYGCSKLKSIDLSSFDNSIVINVSSMFNGCSSLTSLDLSKFDLTNVTTQSSADYMVNGCTSLMELKAPKNIQSGISITLPTKTGYAWYEKGSTTAITALTSAQSGKTLEFCLIK